jgi:hypothetical protein
MNDQQIVQPFSLSSLSSYHTPSKIDTDKRTQLFFQDSIEFPQSSYATRVPPNHNNDLDPSCVVLNKSNFG